MRYSKKLLIGSNLKMYKTIAETNAYLRELTNLTSDLSTEEVELFIIPSFLSLPTGAQLKNDCIKLGAQNMFWENYGQYTGEISPLMLKEIGTDIIEIGHSERRSVFGETDFDVNKKVLSALSHNFTALLCVGETKQDMELGIGLEKLRIQLKVGLAEVSEVQAKRLWVAYEPVWAIGVDGIPASPDYANNKHYEIRETLVDMYPNYGVDIPILYGGSVSFENSGLLISQPYIDGLFIGRAAWDATSLNTIIRCVLPLWKRKTAR